MDYAAEKNQSAMVRVLLKHGANIDLCRPVPILSSHLFSMELY